MGTAIVQLKIMPDSVEADLKRIEADAQKIITESKGVQLKFEEQPIAFGLNAIIAQFAIDESIPLEPVEEKLRAIQNVSSTDIIDFRRAFG